MLTPLTTVADSNNSSHHITIIGLGTISRLLVARHLLQSRLNIHIDIAAPTASTTTAATKQEENSRPLFQIPLLYEVSIDLSGAFATANINQMASREPQAQRQDQPQEWKQDIEPPFSLSPAIFVPFQGPPGQAPILDQPQQLQKIIENLQAQQDVVRKNMLFLIQQRADNLASKAREELEVLERCKGDEISPLHGEDKEVNERQNKEIDNMFRRLKVLAKRDAKSEDYEAKPDTFNPNKQHPAIHPPAGDGNVEMGGMDNAPKPRTAKAVRDELSRNMRELVDRGTQELEGYDRHAQGILNHYRQSLERRTGRPAPPLTGPTGATVPPRGILKNAGDGGSVSRNERKASGIKFALP
ncbi:uncharacterized protein BP5553_02552 [Venustampulla echinocandica]|uniref:Uncharacterized protein n=1 Tax=Venustampulla echinocandica TaxID=2656787 RepID=A0A370TRQ4_9HELO|nr:uncharacterized protein BP5553_02552 [Venustampulla echinocandica]RDL38212.1 hypothetical protein BP5553_02552 [Venustampulla echinocandica]